MNRIDNKFSELRSKGEKAMIPFVTAGDPDLQTTVEIVKSMEEAGADIIELGIPYSDPLADGPVIQESSQRALSSGAGISNIMETVVEIRKTVEVPLLYLVYYNSVFRYGIEKFIKGASEAGIDGLIIPDLPLEERQELANICECFNIHLIPLIAPTSKERIKTIVHKAKGFVYCVSVAGVTGTRDSISTNIEEYMKTIGEYTDLPKALGFGISSAGMAEKYKNCADGIIVGSAIIKRIAEARDKESKIKAASDFVREVKAVL
jgi:tryptophan synthase alpha chain